MTKPTVIRHVDCLGCGREARIVAVEVAEGVITFPAVYCATCLGFPEMVVRSTRNADTLHSDQEATH